MLPCELPLVGLTLEITDDLERYSNHGQVHSVLLRFRVSGATELDRLEFELNGVPLPQTPVRKLSMQSIHACQCQVVLVLQVAMAAACT